MSPPSGIELLESPAQGALPATPLLAAELLPAAPQVQRWRIVKGPGAGTTFERTITPTSRFTAQVADRWGARRSYFLALDPKGVLTMSATIAHEDAAITHFEPPLVMAPARLITGESFIARSSMRVVEENAPQRILQEGRGERTVTLEGVQRVRTPMGEFDAHRVRVRFSASLQLATAEDVATLHVAPGRGVIAEEREERIRALGIINRVRHTIVVRVE